MNDNDDEPSLPTWLTLTSATTTTTTTLVLLLTCLWWCRWGWGATRKPREIPPGPGPALPLLGHLHLLAGQDPRVSFRRWRARYGDVFSLYLGRQLVVVLNGYPVIHEALVKRGDVFSDRPHLPFLEMVSKSRGIIDTSGELWRDQRRTSVRILRELGMGRNVLAFKVQQEVQVYVQAILHRIGASGSLGQQQQQQQEQQQQEDTKREQQVQQQQNQQQEQQQEQQQQKHHKLLQQKQYHHHQQQYKEQQQQQQQQQKQKAEGRCLDLGRLTYLSIANNICSVVFGKRYEYDDTEFHKQLDVMEGYVKAGGVSALCFICPMLRFLPGDMFRIKEKVSLYRQLRDDFVQPILDRHFQRYHHSHKDKDNDKDNDDKENKDNDNKENDNDNNDHSADDFISGYIDVIRGLTNEKTKQHVNENNLQRLVLELFAGATDTTSTTLLWALAYLLHHPHVQERCHQEVHSIVGTHRPPTMLDKPSLPYVEAVIQETLRFAGTSPLAFPHSVSSDVSFAGYVIPRGTFVLVYLDTALRDVTVWGEDADHFRPERFLDAEGGLVRHEKLIPFGAGKRSCLGEPLARTELFLYLSTLVQRFHFLPPEEGQLPSLEGIMGITKFPHPFELRIVPRDVHY